MAEQKKTRVLYMEDDAGLAKLLKRSMERRDYQIDLTADGEEGLAILAKREYDILLLDYRMPGLGGLDVIRRLTAHGPLPPTIMVTGDGNVEIAVEALKLGASDYIIKDPDMKYLDLLPVIIEQVLTKHRLVKERERMIEAVRESEERYRGLVELSPDGILLHAGGKLLFANSAAARYLGAPNAESLAGMPVLDFVHPDFQETVGERIRLLEKQADCVPWIEERLIRLDGRELEVEVAGAPAFYKGMPAVQEIFRDIKERKLQARRLEHMALYDGLTDLPNRSLFFDRIYHALAVARRNRHLFALLFIDLDGFKKVNDTYGHDVGDLLLMEVSKRLLETVRDSDTVARMGGDEFAVVLTRIQRQDDPAIVARKIIANLSQPFELQGFTCTVGASIGISCYPADGEDAEALLKMADTAMYAVKNGGKNGFRFYGGPGSGAGS